MRRCTSWAAAIALLIAGSAASAHEGSTSYLTLDARASDSAVAGRYDAALIDLALAAARRGRRRAAALGRDRGHEPRDCALRRYGPRRVAGWGTLHSALRC